MTPKDNPSNSITPLILFESHLNKTITNYTWPIKLELEEGDRKKILIQHSVRVQRACSTRRAIL